MNKYIIFIFLVILSLTIPQKAFAQSQVFKDISYVSNSNLKQQKLDIYTPLNAIGENLPVHIFVHGGAWSMGDKRLNTAKGEAYTNKNIILVSINYRLSPEYKHPIHVEDCVDAIKWVVDNISKYGGNPDNMVLSGHSAGAHLVALLGTHPQYLKTNGLSQNMFKSILPIDIAKFDLTVKHQGKLSRFIQKKIDGAFGTNTKALLDASPLHQISKTNNYSPFTIFVTATRPFAVAESKLFSSTLKKKGHKAQTIIINNGSSHKDMNTAIFDPKSAIFQAIIKAIN